MPEEKLSEKKNKGLWHNIHAKRKRGEKPAKKGDKDYPKTLDVEGGPGSGPQGGDEDNPFDREPSDDELKDIEKQFEGFAGALKKEDRKAFDKGRQKQSEVLGYTLTGTPDVKTKVGDATGGYIPGKGKIKEAKKRDYKAEYKKYGSSKKAKKYRAELNAYNRKKGTYGNGDKKDASHKGGKIVGFEEQSKNRGRAEKSRLKKESKGESRMAKSDLFKMAKYTKVIHGMLKDEMDLPEWVESKITRAADYLGSVKHYLEYELKRGEQFQEGGPGSGRPKDDVGGPAHPNVPKKKKSSLGTSIAGKLQKQTDKYNKARKKTPKGLRRIGK